MGDLKAVVYQGVSTAWRKMIRAEAAKYLNRNSSSTAAKKQLSVNELLVMNGNSSRGLTVYKTNCSVCHQVNGEGMDFGPKLLAIGSNLGKDGQYLCIIYPDAGISFGFEAYDVKLKDGSTLTGIVSSKTETDLQMKFPGGLVQNYKMADVVRIKKNRLVHDAVWPSGSYEHDLTCRSGRVFEHSKEEVAEDSYGQQLVLMYGTDIS